MSGLALLFVWYFALLPLAITLSPYRYLLGVIFAEHFVGADA
jgi:hypothetical protein